MRKILAIIIILIALPAFAGDQTITLQWDASEQGVTGYSLFMGDTETEQMEQLNPELITETKYVHVFSEPIEGQKYFHVKATDGRNWSGPSNVVSTMVDTKAPAAVTNITISSD